jgi:hypothetical protein
LLALNTAERRIFSAQQVALLFYREEAECLTKTPICGYVEKQFDIPIAA